MTDRFTRTFLPLIGHWTETTGITRGGALVAVLHVVGYAGELASAAQLVAQCEGENLVIRNVAAPGLEVWTHFVRRPEQAARALPDCRSWYARRFDAEYRERCLGSALFRNDLFVTIVMQPDAGLAASLRALRRHAVPWKRGGKGPFAHARADDWFLREFEDVVSKVEAGLSRLGARRLGMRRENGVWFSEIAEAQYQALNGYYRPIPLTCGDLGALLYQDRFVFGAGAVEQRGTSGSWYAAALSIKEYPARTHPLMFDALLRVPCGVVATDSFICRQKAQVLDQINFRGKQMMSAADPAVSQIAELAQLADDVQSNRAVFGSHHRVVVVRTRTLEGLGRAASHVQALMASAGMTVVREDRALKAAVFSQLPGNRGWRVRPGGLNSRNYASLAALNNVPAGSRRHRWGAPLICFRTTADTEYAFGFHVTDAPTLPAEDLGTSVLTGGPGAGKTTLLGGMLLSAERQGARVVVIDKDCGLAPMCRATGGVYLVLPAGEPSGLAPLRGLADTPEDRSFLEDFIKNLILSDGGKPLTPDEDARLKRAVALQMRMPAEMRTLEGVAGMLGQRDMEGAAARLRSWCRDGRLGWAFDGDHDDLRLDARLIGFDTTALLKNPAVSAPTLAYLFYRTRKLLDGTPFVLAVDEFWQAFRVPSFVAMAEDQIRTIRKKEGVVLMATQSPHDLVVSPIAHLFKQSVPTKIFFGDEGADPNDLAALDLTAQEIRVVKQTLPLMRHAFLVKRPGGSVICRFDLSAIRHHVAVLSGREATYGLMLRLIGRHGDRPEDWVPTFEAQAHLAAVAPSQHQHDKAVEEVAA